VLPQKTGWRSPGRGGVRSEGGAERRRPGRRPGCSQGSGKTNERWYRGDYGEKEINWESFIVKRAFIITEHLEFRTVVPKKR